MHAPAARNIFGELDTDADEQQLATLQRLTERYCVVYQTLTAAPPLSTTFDTL